MSSHHYRHIQNDNYSKDYAKKTRNNQTDITKEPDLIRTDEEFIQFIKYSSVVNPSFTLAKPVLEKNIEFWD